MLSNNNLNLEEHKSDDQDSINYGNSLWNSHNKSVLIPIETIFLDCNDKNIIKTISKQRVEEIFSQYERKWTLQNYRKINMVDVTRIMLMNFDINSLDEVLRNDEAYRNKIKKNETDLNHMMNIIDDLHSNYDGEISEENIISKVEYDKYCSRKNKIFLKNH